MDIVAYSKIQNSENELKKLGKLNTEIPITTIERSVPRLIWKGMG